MGIESRFEILEKPDWTWIIYEFVKKNISVTVEFKRLNDLIASRYKDNIAKISPSSDPKAQSAYWLESFVSKLIRDSLNSSMSGDTYVEHAALFRSELELSPIEHFQTNYLEGLVVPELPVRIADGILLRKADLSDWEYTKEIFDDDPTPWDFWGSVSVLEINMASKSEGELSQVRERILTACRLYRLGSIHLLQSRSTKKSAIWGDGTQRGWSNRGRDFFKRLVVTESEAGEFVSFIQAIEKSLGGIGSGDEHHGLRTSISRYGLAILESFDTERRILNGVMGLESLFTTKKDVGENAFKLALRVARLLAVTGLDGTIVRADLEEGYKLRNKVVHGQPMSAQEKGRMESLTEKILDYLRIAVVLALLAPRYRKDEVIEALDSALLHGTTPAILDENARRLTTQFPSVGKILLSR